MPQTVSIQSMYASVREYLEGLAESGVDGIAEGQGQERQGPGAGGQGPEKQELVVLPAPGPWPLDPDSRTLEEVRQHLGDCQRCGLAPGRKNLVFGTGNPQASLLFVGEAPGADEDRQGEPFVGEAGAILTRMITRMGLTRQDVYICNVLKCRPPGNRNPQKEEIELCSPFLLEQIRAINPRVIVALGTFSAQTLLNSKEPISRLRGNIHDFNGIPLMPTFHPSFLLRNKTDKQRYWEVWEDMVQVLQKLGMPVPDKQGSAS